MDTENTDYFDMHAIGGASIYTYTNKHNRRARPVGRFQYFGSKSIKLTIQETRKFVHKRYGVPPLTYKQYKSSRIFFFASRFFLIHLFQKKTKF